MLADAEGSGGGGSFLIQPLATRRPPSRSSTLLYMFRFFFLAQPRHPSTLAFSSGTISLCRPKRCDAFGYTLPVRIQ